MFIGTRKDTSFYNCTTKTKPKVYNCCLILDFSFSAVGSAVQRVICYVYKYIFLFLDSVFFFILILLFFFVYNKFSNCQDGDRAWGKQPGTFAYYIFFLIHKYIALRFQMSLHCHVADLKKITFLSDFFLFYFIYHYSVYFAFI